MTVKHSTWHTHLIKNPKPDEPITELVEGFSCKDCEKDVTVPMAVLSLCKKISSKEQAEMALAILQKEGLVTTAQLSAINQKYPSDPIYHARTLLKANIETVRAGKGNTIYKLI